MLNILDLVLRSKYMCTVKDERGKKGRVMFSGLLGGSEQN